jgi:hypothetical protein
VLSQAFDLPVVIATQEGRRWARLGS